MKEIYPGKTLVFQHDNLLSHKSSLIMKIMQDNDLEMIFSPSHTPEFSAVENVFADLKR
jgi:transposase